MRTAICAAALSVALVAGCLPPPDDGTSGGTSGSSGAGAADGGDSGLTRAGQACNDLATAYATAAKRCGGDYDSERTAFIRDLANGDCNSVSIRSYSELAKCIPTFGSISCSDLKEQRFAPDCAEQIVRSR